MPFVLLFSFFSTLNLWSEDLNNSGSNAKNTKIFLIKKDYIVEPKNKSINIVAKDKKNNDIKDDNNQNISSTANNMPSFIGKSKKIDDTENQSSDKKSDYFTPLYFGVSYENFIFPSSFNFKGSVSPTTGLTTGSSSFSHGQYFTGHIGLRILEDNIKAEFETTVPLHGGNSYSSFSSNGVILNPSSLGTIRSFIAVGGNFLFGFSTLNKILSFSVGLHVGGYSFNISGFSKKFVPGVGPIAEISISPIKRISIFLRYKAVFFNDFSLNTNYTSGTISGGSSVALPPYMNIKINMLQSVSAGIRINF